MVESCWKCNHILVDILAGLFGIGAWLLVNAIYTQLPLLVETLPEEWNLLSYLSILIQLANIGPILFSLLKRYAPNAIYDNVLITFIMLLGTFSTLVLSFTYHLNVTIFEVNHSLPLFILTFLIALVGCTSSVLFIPFMNNYPEIHLVSYLVGEGLSGFIPSIVSLIQGVGISECVNVTVNGTAHVESVQTDPWFSSQVFFIIMFLLMCISTVSFLLLNKLPPCKMVRLRKKTISVSSSTFETTDDDNSTNFNNPVSTSDALTLAPSLYIGLLLLQSVISMFSNGILPSIQSYSCLPYGKFAFHIAVNLANMANPAACFIAFFLPRTSIKSISVMSVMAAIPIIYNITTAVLSPHPPLQNELSGTVLIVSSWVICVGLVSFVKLSIAAVFRREGGRGLFWYGAVTQAGAFIGSILSFYFVNIQSILKTLDTHCEV